MIALMALGEARPGYELWRPNRAKSGSLTSRFVVMLLLLISAALMLIVILGGWSLLVGGATFGVIGIVFAAVYLLLAVMVGRWSRGALTLSIAFGVLLLIFCAVGANSWFARAKSGFIEAALPSDIIGLLVVILIPVQLVLVVVAAIAFTQEWHVEAERSLSDGSAPPPGQYTKPGKYSRASDREKPLPTDRAPRSAARVNPSGPT